MSRKIYDLSRLRKTYPLRRRRPVYAEVDDSHMETVVLLVTENTALPVTYTFENQFTGIPVCVATAQNQNVNVFITSLTTTAVQLDISGNIPSGENIKIQLQIFRNKSLED
jgi:hypothetical protein